MFFKCDSCYKNINIIKTSIKNLPEKVKEIIENFEKISEPIIEEDKNKLLETLNKLKIVVDDYYDVHLITIYRPNMKYHINIIAFHRDFIVLVSIYAPKLYFSVINRLTINEEKMKRNGIEIVKDYAISDIVSELIRYVISKH